jgi:hypothetical protein
LATSPRAHSPLRGFGGIPAQTIAAVQIEVEMPAQMAGHRFPQNERLGSSFWMAHLLDLSAPMKDSSDRAQTEVLNSIPDSVADEQRIV